MIFHDIKENMYDIINENDGMYPYYSGSTKPEELGYFPDPYDMIYGSRDSELVYKLLDYVSPCERKVIEVLFGLEDGNPKGLAEAAEQLGCSQERIRRLAAEALIRMRKVYQKHYKSDFYPSYLN